MEFDPRIGCSSITFRKLPRAEALATIASLGFATMDLGALPGVCDHVPFGLERQDIDAVAADVAASGLAVTSVNGDIGDLNEPVTGSAAKARADHLDRLLELTAALGARALVLPCGALDHSPRVDLDTDLDAVATALNEAGRRAERMGVELWTESLHYFRLSYDANRAARLHARLDDGVGVVLDFSHVTATGADVGEFVRATGPRIRHVHVRDAVPGNIHISVGRGTADFAGGIHALAGIGYEGAFALELETRDVTDAERPAAALLAAKHISRLLHSDAAGSSEETQS
jgi:sugar phosphate isomerase/epimerase